MEFTFRYLSSSKTKQKVDDAIFELKKESKYCFPD